MTAFFIGNDLGDVANNGIPLMRELERYLQTFGGHLQPYVREEDNATIDPEVFLDPDAGRADCSVCFALHPVEGASLLVVRYVFPLCVTFSLWSWARPLSTATPPQCRLYDRWFLHEQGGWAIYCEHVAPRRESQDLPRGGRSGGV